MVFTETPAGLLYTEQGIPLLLRLVAGFFGVLMFAIPYPFLVNASWQDGPLSMLVATLGVLMPLLTGAFFIAIGLVGAQRVEFDTARRRRLLRTARGPLGRRRAVIGFERVDAVELVRHAGVDDPDVHEIVLRLRGHRPIKLGAYHERAQAEHWQQRLQAMVNG
jgi:hypothetical protein